MSYNVPAFPRFDRFACEGDSVSTMFGPFEVRATIYRDDDCTPPDERSDGFYPSRDKASAGWCGPNVSAAKFAALAKQAREVMDEWKRDQWFYCGIAVTVWMDGRRLGSEFSAALWGVECNYPTFTASQAKRRNQYLSTVADEMASDAVTNAMESLECLLSAGERLRAA